MRGLIGLLCLWLIAGAALPASAQSPVERGRYLVEVLGACGNCHTPKGPEGDLPGKHLAGGFQLEEEFGIWITPNITSDPETGIGRWTDDEVIRAIREGRGRDGKTLGPPMPFDLYRRLADSDVKAMVAYLRTVAPVRKRGAPEPVQDPAAAVLRARRWARCPTRRGRTPSSTASTWPARSRTAWSATRPFSPRAGPTRPGWARAGSRSRAVGRELRREPDARPGDGPRRLEGRRDHRRPLRRAPRGGRVLPPMPTQHYSQGIAEGDLRAIIAYLRSLPPIRNKVPAPEPPKKP